MEVRILAQADDLFRAAAGEFVRLAEAAVRVKSLFAVCLSGGSTPQGLYSLLASESALRSRIPWEAIHFFWGDERHVPPEHAESNFRMVQESMLSKVPVPALNVHRIRAEFPDANQAANDYEQTLRDFFKLEDGQFPQFDLVLLGMGADGHTASLFPGTRALREERRLVVSNWIDKVEAERITLTAPVLNNAACVVFMAQGEEKAPVLKAVLEGPYEPDRLPAQLIRPAHGSLLWLVDRKAGGFLTRPS